MADRRQAGYDALVYTLRSRFPAGLAGRLQAVLQDGANQAALLLEGWPGLNWQQPAHQRLHVLLFLLEELTLYLTENANTSFHHPGQGMLQFQKELRDSLLAVSIAA